MEALKTAGIGVSAALIIGSLISMIIPKQNFKKIIYLFLSIYIIISIITPLSDALFYIKNYQPNEIETTFLEENSINENDEIIKIIEENTSKSLFPIIKTELNNLNILGEFGIKTELLYTKNGVEIEKVYVSLENLNNLDEEIIQTTLSQNTGLKIKVKRG